MVGILYYNPTNNELYLFGNEMFGATGEDAVYYHDVTPIINTLVSKLIGIPVNLRVKEIGDLRHLFTFPDNNGLNHTYNPWGGFSWPYYYLKFSGKKLSCVTKRQEQAITYTQKNPVYNDEFTTTNIPIETPTIPTTLGNGTFSSITASSTPPSAVTGPYNYPPPPNPISSKNPAIKIGYLFYKLPDDLQTKFNIPTTLILKRESTPGNTAFKILKLLSNPEEIAKLGSPADDSPILLL